MYNETMIAHVIGVVTEKFGSSLIVGTNGVGYEVQVTTGDYERALPNEKIKLYTYHHIREQSQELFGFSSLAAKKLFELLISVQGVGPKAALAILSLGDSEIVREAIASSDTLFIAKASGIGRRTAERVAVDLSDKVGLVSDTTANNTRRSSVRNDALDALVALGYSLADASRALENVPSELSTSERVTQALKNSQKIL
jgi:Holliday junction DNA helicase RuvA